MRTWTLAAAVAFGALAAGRAGAQAPAAVEAPQQPQIINLSLLEALLAVKAQELAGVFGFVEEKNAPAAFADYLFHNRPALKRFVKKGERDSKQAGGVNEWDKQVYLYLLGINASAMLPQGYSRLSSSWVDRLSTLSLAPGLTLSELTARRKK